MGKYEIRTKLSEWADRQFGRLHPPNDKLVVYEEVNRRKNGDWQQTITLEVKKAEAYQKNWISEEVKIRWKKEIKEIVGEYMKLMLNSSLGVENAHISGFKNNQEFIEKDAVIYHYQFKVEISRVIKRSKGHRK